jgi:hypothetical protein
MIHAVSFVAETGAMLEPNSPSGDWRSLSGIASGLMFFDYSWLDGNMIWLKFIFICLQWVFGLLIARDILRFFRGVG